MFCTCLSFVDNPTFGIGALEPSPLLVNLFKSNIDPNVSKSELINSLEVIDVDSITYSQYLQLLGSENVNFDKKILFQNLKSYAETQMLCNLFKSPEKGFWNNCPLSGESINVDIGSFVPEYAGMLSSYTYNTSVCFWFY